MVWRQASRNQAESRQRSLMRISVFVFIFVAIFSRITNDWRLIPWLAFHPERRSRQLDLEGCVHFSITAGDVVIAHALMMSVCWIRRKVQWKSRLVVASFPSMSE